VLEPPAGIETVEVQVTFVASTRVQVQSAPLAPPFTRVTGHVIGPGSTSRNEIVPMLAASPELVTTNA
jgi:hypothetical protein